MSIDPRAPEENLIARVEVVAVNQLEEAIRAWFRYGDPASIHFFEKVGLDYVSASPYRIPVSRLAAAQAALQTKVGD